MWSYADDVNYSKLFDEKTALNSEYQYSASSNDNGENGAYRFMAILFLVARH